MLLHIKRNMEEEEKLMANVPGWEVSFEQSQTHNFRKLIFDILP
jgi:GRIM-19 protein